MKIKPTIIAIGTSAGGVDALRKILPQFKRPSPLSVVVTIHFPPTGPNLFSELFSDLCSFRIKEAEPGETLERETIYIAPADYHLSFEADGTLSLSTEEPVNFSRPSIDIMMESGALAHKEKMLGILLTGASPDGARGMESIHRHGGMTIVQDPASADYPTMPKSALDLFSPSLILNLDDIANFIPSFSPGVL